MVIGISAAKADVPTLAGVLTGPVISPGGSMAAIGLLDSGATPIVVVGTALHRRPPADLVLGGDGHPLARHAWVMTAVAAYLLIDPSFAVGVDGYARWPERGAAPARLLPGGAVVLWLGWLAAILAGALAGARLPSWLHPRVRRPLYLIGEIVPKLRGAVTRRTVIAAVVVAVAAFFVPLHLGVVIAIVAGLVAGLTARPRSGATEEVLDECVARHPRGHLGSYLFRIGFVAMADRIAMPVLMERASELIAPARSRRSPQPGS